MFRYPDKPTVVVVNRDWVEIGRRSFDLLDDAVAYSLSFPEYGDKIPVIWTGARWINKYFQEEDPPY